MPAGFFGKTGSGTLFSSFFLSVKDRPDESDLVVTITCDCYKLHAITKHQMWIPLAMVQPINCMQSMLLLHPFCPPSICCCLYSPAYSYGSGYPHAYPYPPSYTTSNSPHDSSYNPYTLPGVVCNLYLQDCVGLEGLLGGAGAR